MRLVSPAVFVLLAVLTDGAWAWAPALVKSPVKGSQLSAGKSGLLLPSVRRARSGTSHISRPAMNFLGFDLSDLKSIGNMIIQCEGSLISTDRKFTSHYSSHCQERYIAYFLFRAASHILITGEDSDETCMALKDTIRRAIDIPAGVGLAQAFAAVRTLPSSFFPPTPLDPPLTGPFPLSRLAGVIILSRALALARSAHVLRASPLKPVSSASLTSRAARAERHAIAAAATVPIGTKHMAAAVAAATPAMPAVASRSHLHRPSSLRR